MKDVELVAFLPVQEVAPDDTDVRSNTSDCGHHQVLIVMLIQSEDALGQISIFNIKMEQEPKLYDRIVLSLCQTPKKNPHHLLVTKILKEGESLSNNGYLYVFSNQKLFVPSHSERVEGLLKKIRIQIQCVFLQHRQMEEQLGAPSPR